MPVFETSFGVLGLVALAAYLLGSVPFGLVVARAMGLPDPRGIGSGNIGATNVLRTGSKTAALATLVLDAVKGLAAVLMARFALGEDAAQVAGLAAFLGHVFPVWLRFKGGKGVATFLGTLLGLSVPLGLAGLATWAVAFLLFRISSLSALVAAASMPLAAIALGQGRVSVVTFVMVLIVFWAHRANIARLRAGNEPRVGKGK